MKKPIIQGVLTLVAIIFTCCVTDAQKIGFYGCKWHTAASAGDEEGLINRMQYDAKSKFLVMFTNDEENLYIDLVLAERAAIQKVSRFGLTTWFNPQGKHKKGMGIQFPVPQAENGESPFKREKGGDPKEMMKAMMASKNKEMVLIGFGRKGERRAIDLRVDSSFHGRVDMMEGGKMHVSLMIPLNKLGRDSETFDMPFSAGFETGYLDLNQAGMTSGGGQGGPGGGGPGGGMPGGGPPPGGSGPPPGSGSGGQIGNSDQQTMQPNISELASPSKLWISQVKLAKKP